MTEFDYTFDVFLEKDTDAVEVDLRDMDGPFLERMIQEAATAADRGAAQAAAAVLHGIEPIRVYSFYDLAEMAGSDATEAEAEAMFGLLTDRGFLLDGWLVCPDDEWERALHDAIDQSN
jgi:hypothetical protein